MSTAAVAAAATLICLVVPQVGVVRSVSPIDVHTYRSPVQVPCDLDDNAALDFWRGAVRREQDEECPRCFPNDRPWSR
jgi:hypothetical protein